jgi:hypothetical protein
MPRDRVVFRFSKTKLVAFILIEVILLVLFAYMVLRPLASTRYSPGFQQFIGLWGMLAMATVTALNIVRLVDSRPGLVVDRRGLVDRTSFAGVG